MFLSIVIGMVILDNVYCHVIGGINQQTRSLSVLSLLYRDELRQYE